MVHELLNIQNGRVDLSLVPEIRPELRVRPIGYAVHNICTNTSTGDNSYNPN